MPEKRIIVETRDLTKVYGDGAEVRALDGVNLIVREGEFIAVEGPSGSGKSTLLHLIGALDRPTRGQVIVNGEDLAQVRNLDRFRSQTVGFVFQLHNLIPTLTAVENVEVPMQESQMTASARHRRARQLLETVGLGARLGHLPNQLSGGERQRVAIARALANDPAIVLADEPTGNLDSQSRAETMALMRELNRAQGKTFIVVTHNPDVAHATDRIVTLRDGKIVKDKPVSSLYLEALKDLRNSVLGQAVLEGKLPEEIEALGLARLAPGLREVLEKV